MATKKKSSKKPVRKVATKAGKKSARKAATKTGKLELMAAEIQRLRRKLAKLEKRRQAKPPKKSRVSQTLVNERRTSIKLFLEQVKRGAEGEGLHITFRTHVNSDNSIDGELRLQLEDSGDLKDNLIRLEDSADWNSLSDYWVMMGLNAQDTEATGSPTIDKRPHRAWTNPVKGNRSGAAFLTLRETVADNLEAYFGKEGAFTLIVVRLHWSYGGQAPDRPRKS